MTNHLTFSDGHTTITLALGHRQGVQRTTGDICLSRHPHCALPVKITLLVHADGQIEEWYADWDHRSNNPYWHFDHGSQDYAYGNPAYRVQPAVPTPTQRIAIAQLFYGHPQAFGLGGTVCAPVQYWCQFRDIAELEALGNAGYRGVYA